MRGGPRVLGIVLAGGEGKRLAPLTQDRAKPAVPFGGNYRLIDFVLSNLVNAEVRQIAVLTQYKSQDRKSTRLNSSHANISYAVFCLKKKKKTPTSSWCISVRDKLPM